MKVVVADRGEGKTTRLLAWVRAAPEGEHRVIVSHSVQRATDLRRANPDLESWQFVGIEELVPGAWSGVLMGRGGWIALALDDLDLSLRSLLRWPVGAASLTASTEVTEITPPDPAPTHIGRQMRDVVSPPNPAESGIPEDFWLPVPCGHPAEPWAARGIIDGRWVCHCGTAVDEQAARTNAYLCPTCGCHTRIPITPPDPEPDRLALVEQALRNANDVLRSVSTVVDRDGKETNWAALSTRVYEVLTEQHRLMYPIPPDPDALDTDENPDEPPRSPAEQLSRAYAALRDLLIETRPAAVAAPFVLLRHSITLPETT